MSNTITRWLIPKLSHAEGFSLVFRSRSRTRIEIIPVQEVENLDGQFHVEFPEIYSFLVKYDKRIKTTTDRLPDYTKHGIVPVFYDIDIDLPKEDKDKIKQTLQETTTHTLRGGLYQYKLSHAKLVKENFPGINMLFANTTTFFHVLIPTPYVKHLALLNSISLNVFYKEWEAWATKILKILPDCHTDKYHIFTKAVRNEILNPDERLDNELLRNFSDTLGLYPVIRG